MRRGVVLDVNKGGTMDGMQMDCQEIAEHSLLWRHEVLSTYLLL